MKFEKLNTWLQLAANTGIIASLLLVGAQLKQNADLLKTQLLYEESDRTVRLENEVIGENGAEVWAKAMTEPENLTLAEQRIMEALLFSFTEQIRGTKLLADLGLLEDSEWRYRVRTEAGFRFGHPYGRAWWKNYADSDSLLSAELLEEVEDRLAEAEPQHALEYMRETMRNLQAPESTPGNE